ncbi:MAG: ATP-binding protein [Methylobacter sp.]|nr:ATP-binding protein [Methylobacter sp.]
MESTKKDQIVEKVREYITRFESQNKAANSLKGVSAATISQVLNGNWELIKDDMWRNIGSQVGYTETEWAAVETRDFKVLSKLMIDAQLNSNVYAITGHAGTGKTFTVRQFAANNRRVHLLQCAEYWNKKMFMQELLSAMGKDYAGATIGEMMQEIVSELKRQKNPLIVLDEADKLTDQVLYFFITLYNQLEDQAGIILCATNYLEKRIKRGVKLNKKGYNEIYSRIGRKCIELKGLSAGDISAICQANGIEDRNDIQEVIQDCESDLRRVKRSIHALKNKA